VSAPAVHIHWTKTSDANEATKAVKWRVSYKVFSGGPTAGGAGSDLTTADAVVEYEDTYDDAGTTPAESTARLPDTETAIRNDPNLTNEQREALLSVYRSYRSANAAQR
jgi:hypothetical protein